MVVDFNKLMEMAESAAEAAYAPYSNFQVGASVLTKSGQVFIGANVENASYGLTVCAERVAIFSAVVAGHKNITALAIFSPMNRCVSPCGACRQVLAEFARPDAIVISREIGNGFRRWTVAELLPDSFGRGDLESLPMV